MLSPPSSILRGSKPPFVCLFVSLNVALALGFTICVFNLTVYFQVTYHYMNNI